MLESAGKPPEEVLRRAGRERRVDLPSDEGQATAKGDGAASAAAKAAVPIPAVRLGPFGETANPAEYVPREATEQALLALERAVRDRRLTALVAPPGLGKSLLLQLLAKRLAPGFVCLFLPYASLTMPELSAWALGLLGERVGDDPQADFLRFVRRAASEGRVLLLLIDDAGSMPLETARGLGALVRESLPLRTDPGRTGNRLRVVVAAGDDAASSRVIAALHPRIAQVRFMQPMSALETRHYVQTRLAQASVSEERCARFDDEAIGWIYHMSGGVPRLVHHVAGSLLDDAPEDVGRAWGEESWLDAPTEQVHDSLRDPGDGNHLDPDADVPFPEVPIDFDDSLRDVGDGVFLDQDADLQLPEAPIDNGSLLDFSDGDPLDEDVYLESDLEFPKVPRDDDDSLLDFSDGDLLDEEVDLKPDFNFPELAIDDDDLDLLVAGIF